MEEGELEAKAKAAQATPMQHSELMGLTLSQVSGLVSTAAFSPP